jgi:hypothetical protein
MRWWIGASVESQRLVFGRMALAMLLIEKMINNITNFNKEVITRFAEEKDTF